MSITINNGNSVILNQKFVVCEGEATADGKSLGVGVHRGPLKDLRIKGEYQCGTNVARRSVVVTPRGRR